MAAQSESPSSHSATSVDPIAGAEDGRDRLADQERVVGRRDAQRRRASRGPGDRGSSRARHDVWPPKIGHGQRPANHAARSTHARSFVITLRALAGSNDPLPRTTKWIAPVASKRLDRRPSRCLLAGTTSVGARPLKRFEEQP